MGNIFKFNKINKINDTENLSSFNFFKKLNYFNNFNGINNQSNKRKFKRIVIFIILIFISVVFLYVLSSTQESTNSFSNNSYLNKNLYASTTNNNANLTSQSQLSIFDIIVKLVLAIIIIAILIFISIYILKYFYLKKNKLNVLNNKNNSSKLINIIESINLENNKKLYLIKILDKVMLISSTENQINLISEFKNETINEFIVEDKENIDVSENKNFKSFFLNFFKNTY
jgi:flagellar biogenesis protein FliO